MIECQICGDQEGPWEYERDPNDKKYMILVCEDCAKVLRKQKFNKRRNKKCYNQSIL